MQIDNPRLAGSVRAFSVTVVIVLIGGILLLVYPEAISGRWPWKLTPFNTRFLGAFYTAEIVAMGWLAWRNRWSPGRLVLIMALVFTLIVSLVCLGYLERFNFGRKAAWLWFVLYIGSALFSAYFLWRNWQLPHPARALFRPWRAFYLVQALAIGAYGVALLLVPETAGAFWPWPLDRFHAQIYSGIFLAASSGAAVLAWKASAEDLLVFGASQLALGLAVVASLIIANASLGKVDWGAGGTWLWIGGFLAFVVLGGISLALGRRLEGATA